MLRKTLLATTVGVLISPVAMAADVATPTISAFVSDEYLSTAVSTDVLSHPAIGFTIGAEYAVSDVIDLTFTGSALDDTTLPSSIVVACDVGADAPGVTLGLLSATPDDARYRVTELDGTCLAGSGSTVGMTFPICTGAAACDFGAQEVDAANGVTMSFSAQTSTGLALDTGGGDDRSTAVFLTGSQFAAEVTTAFDGIIDVEQDRERFTTGATDAATYDVTFNNFPDGTELVFAVAAAVDQDVDVSANFGFLFDTDDTTDGIQPAAGVVTWPSCPTTAFAADGISGEGCGYGPATITIDLTNNVEDGNNAVLEATSFVSTHELNFTGIGAVANSITVINVALGSWTLNGFQAKVAYMPFQTGIGQVIYLANRGSQTGEITVDWIDQNGNSGSFNIGDINAGSTRAIGPAIQAGLPAAQQNGGRLALVITANVPACDAQLNAQYNVSGDRAFSVSTNNCPVITD